MNDWFPFSKRVSLSVQFHTVFWCFESKMSMVAFFVQHCRSSDMIYITVRANWHEKCERLDRAHPGSVSIYILHSHIRWSRSGRRSPGADCPQWRSGDPSENATKLLSGFSIVAPGLCAVKSFRRADFLGHAVVFALIFRQQWEVRLQIKKLNR